MPQNLEWSDTYSVGHAGLDAEHRDMMEVIFRINGAGADHTCLRPLLCELRQKADAHFSHESAILRQIIAATSTARRSQTFLAAMGQALVEEHLAEHDLALAALGSIIRATLSEKVPQMSPPGEILTHWFVNHAIKHDAHLKTLFQTIQSDCPELLARVA